MEKNQNNVKIDDILVFIEKAVKNFMEQDPPKEVRDAFNQ